MRVCEFFADNVYSSSILEENGDNNSNRFSSQVSYHGNDLSYEMIKHAYIANMHITHTKISSDIFGKLKELCLSGNWMNSKNMNFLSKIRLNGLQSLTLASENVVDIRPQLILTKMHVPQQLNVFLSGSFDPQLPLLSHNFVYNVENLSWDLRNVFISKEDKPNLLLMLQAEANKVVLGPSLETIFDR